LVSLAFHPDYASNGYVYVYYQTGTSSALLERYRCPVPSTYQIDPSSARTIVGPIQDVIAFHLGGGIAFGPDGKLHLAIGDRRKELPGLGCTAQDPLLLLGKLLRLEDDGTVPLDNPFVGVPGVDPRILGVGLRQPFGLHFDALSGALYVADVGESDREELDRIAPGPPLPLNFGWRSVEGSLCTGSELCAFVPCSAPNLHAPVYEYDHAGGCCIIGGGLYRGSALGGLWGCYLHTDHCSGALRALRFDGAHVAAQFDVGIAPPAGHSFDALSCIADGPQGELLLLDWGDELSAQGELYRVVADKTLSADTYTLSLAQGGAQQLRLDLDAAFAGKVHCVIGSAQGTLPGFQLESWLVPLNLDAYSLYCIGAPNSGVLPDGLGVLDPAGNASAHFVLPAAADPLLAGSVLSHVACVLDPAAASLVLAVTNPVALALLP
jgi:glucose/arabinose dehydrogenase